MLSTVMDKLPGRSHKLVALDWDAQTLKAVEGVISPAGLKIQRVISAHIPEDVVRTDPDAFGAFIKGMLHEKKFGTRQVLMAVPRDRVILINLRLPQGPVGDLSGMVRLQASRELPFSADEAFIDFAGSQAHDAPEFLDLTVGAIQRDQMTFYKQLAYAAGLHLVRLGLRPNSNLVSLTRGAQPLGDDRILFIDIGAQATEISIFRWGRLTFSRAVGITVDAQTGREASGRNLLMEVLRTVEAHRASDTSKIDRIVVAGDTGLESWLVESLASRFDAPATMFDPTSAVAIEKDRAGQMTGFCAPLGLLVGQTVSELVRFDFVNPKQPLNIKALRRKQVTIGGSAAIALLLITWLSSYAYVSSLTTQRNQLKAQIDVLQKKAKECKQVLTRIDSVRNWTDQEVIWIDQLKDLVQQMPDNTDGYATNLQAKGQNRQVDLGMRATSMTLPNDLWNRFVSVDGLDAEIRGWSEGGNPKYPYSGDMVVRISPPAKPGTIKTKPKTGSPQTQTGSASRPMAERPPEVIRR